MNIKQQFKEGLITNNPVLVQLIGMCATMAITTSLFNGIGMGLSVLVILTCCNVVISLIRKVIPNDIRLAIFVLVIAGFVTIVDLLLQAYVPALSASLGVFIPLIVVNCIIIGRAEAFCQKNPVGPSFFDGIFQGLGYTLVLIAMCDIRELLGKGSFGTGIFNTIDGVIGTGNINTDCSPINPATGEPYFTIREAGWGTGWSIGNILRINTVGALFPLWIIRTIQQGPESDLDYSFSLLTRGDVDRP